MKLSIDQVQDKLAKTTGWELRENAIARSFKFGNFKESMKFVNQIADMAEEMDHHPDIFISYNVVQLTLSTHSEGGLTDKDFRLAQKINDLKG